MFFKTLEDKTWDNVLLGYDVMLAQTCLERIEAASMIDEVTEVTLHWQTMYSRFLSYLLT